jgi:hypothetical protein
MFKTFPPILHGIFINGGFFFSCIWCQRNCFSPLNSRIVFLSLNSMANIVNPVHCFWQLTNLSRFESRCIFVCSLFKNILINLNYVASIDRMINEIEKIWKKHLWPNQYTGVNLC